MSWRHFTLEEFACKCGAHTEPPPMQVPFLDRLDSMRSLLGFPLKVTSGFRCIPYDSSIGGAGVHPSGCAANISIAGAQQDALIRLAVRYNVAGIGIKAKGPWAGRFVHLDDLPDSTTHPRPRIWTY